MDYFTGQSPETKAAWELEARWQQWLHRPAKGQHPWAVLRMTDDHQESRASGSVDNRTTEREERNKIHLSGGPMRTHMLTRTSQVSWRPGLLLLIRHGFFFFKKDPGPHLRTTESKAKRLGTYTRIHKELPVRFLCIPQLKGNAAFHNIRYTQSKVTFKFPPQVQVRMKGGWLHTGLKY